jgi:hypothetical protein
VVSRAGSVLLVETVRKSALGQAVSAALSPWWKPRAVHDPGKVLLDVALAVASGGDCLADVGMLRAEPAVFGSVACDPTVSRLVDALAACGEKVLQAICSARAQACERVWRLAGRAAPDVDGTVTVDLDGVLVIAHSGKEDAAPTWERTYGHHPLMAFVDHGPGGTGGPVAALLRPGVAGSNTATDPSSPPAWPWHDCRGSTDAAGRPWSAPIPRAAPTTSWPGSPGGGGGCPTRSAW